MHQIGREKRTTISKVIVRGMQNIKQNRNWFYFKFTVERSSFILKVEADQFVIWLVLPECLSKFVVFHPRTVKGIVTALMPSLLFRCFSLLLSHLRTLAQERFLRYPE